MKDRSDVKHDEILWDLGFGLASVGFVVTWAQPTLLPRLGWTGPIASLPFALLAMWSQWRKRELANPEPAPGRSATRHRGANTRRRFWLSSAPWSRYQPPST
jgi:hypothetical protein